NESAWNDSIYYEWLNGTEGNKSDYEYLETPDKERFGGPFNTSDGYFSYRVVFDPDSLCEFRVDSSAYPDNSDSSWYTYRIPIRDSLSMDTMVISNDSDASLQPAWNKIDHVRIWFEGVPGQTKPDTIEMADWYFIQSNWQDTIVYNSDDSTTKFVVASVSEEDGTFEAPKNVEAYTDPNTDVEESQRGLLLQFEDLDQRDTCLAIKKLISVDRYSGYGRIEMYVHGDYKDQADEGKVWFFLRLGTDSTNYYQQRMQLWSGWDHRNHINLVFDEITALKDSEQRARPRNEWSQIDVYSDDPDGTLRVCGNPNLNAIKYFAAGVFNSDSSKDISGEVWLDELRVSDVRRDVGTAGRISFSGNLADLGSYNFSFQSQDPYFRNISSSTRGGSSTNLGSGQTQTTMSYSASVNMDKFLPRSWGAKIPVSFSYSKTTSTPLLRTGSDIVLPEDIRIEERSLSESRTFQVSPKFSRQGRNPLYNLLLNRITTSFSYRRNSRSSVNAPYSFGENYNVNSSYDLGVRKVPTLPIFFWTKWIPIAKKASESRLGLYPSRWKINSTYERNITITDNVSGDRQHDLKRNFTGTMDIQYKVFDNLTSSLRLDTRRDLSETDEISISLKSIKLGQELRYSQAFSVSYDPKLLSFLGTSWSYKAQYSDDWDRSSTTLRSTLSRSWSINGSFDHIKLLGGKGSSSTGHRRSQQRTRRSRKADVEKKPDKPFYDPPLAVLRFMTGWIQAPKYSYSESFNYSLPGMITRPELKYRFGLTREPGITTISQTRNPSSTQGQNYELSSGFKFLGGISTDVRFNRSISEDLIKQGALFRSVSTNWPDLRIRISQFSTLPLIKGIVNKLIDVFAPSTSYTRSTKETFDINRGFPTSRSESINRSPLLQVNFKLFRGLSISSSYTLSKDIKKDYNRTNGKFQSESHSTRKSFGASTKYSFSKPSGFNFPLLGKVKFKSTMSISIDV
ncbi:MAG: cell surface protein SprA, partial [Candidatus Zixiibacteriota bacterium]